MLILPCSLPQILVYIESLQPTEKEVVMLLFGEQNTPDIPALIQALNSKNIVFFGGVFPGIIYGNKKSTEGCIVKKFKMLGKPFLTQGISSAQFDKFTEQVLPENSEQGTAIVLLDGLSNNVYRFLGRLNDLLGEQCYFIGGGAGSINLEQNPCIFSNEGFMADAAVVCVIDNQVRLGVRHGWQHLKGPFVATKTEGNTILQLNWEPALGIYASIIEDDCGEKIDKNNFARIALGYPFGILREKEDDIVRDPISIGENGSIICTGEVPANSVLHVLKSNAETLLIAAQKAIADCGKQGGLPIDAETTFVVDCITRSIFLDHQFAEELEIIRSNLIINHPGQEPFGILSLGEMSSYGKGLLEVFNKTIVVGTLH